jgi:hypothetical protein
VIYCYKYSSFQRHDCFRLCSTGVWHCVFFCVGLRIEDEHAISIFLVKAGGTRVPSVIEAGCKSTECQTHKSMA